MNEFQLNGYSVRFFQLEKNTYLVTADANKAFGFDGKNTSINEASISVADVPKYESFILDASNGLETLSTRASVIELPSLPGVISRSNKPEPKNMQGIMMQLLAKSFAQNFGMQPNRPMLPAVSDDVRVAKMAGAASSRKIEDKEPQDKINYPGWSTITEMLTGIGEDPSDEDSLIVDSRFRFWLNRQLSDLYRAQSGEEPPVVKRKKGAGFCYPPSFLAQVELYRSTWLGLTKIAPADARATNQ
jgi:hypothetical protein